MYYDDNAAIIAAADDGVGLCTIVGIEGSFSRKIGSQIAVLPDGTCIGSLADGCLENQLSSDLRSSSTASIKRYGRGSDVIDFRLPCGGGLDILIEPEPDRNQIRNVATILKCREQVKLPIGSHETIFERCYLPSLNIVVLGEGPELHAFAALSRAIGLSIEATEPRKTGYENAISLIDDCDEWTAIVLLLHDHELEIPLLTKALASDAFYVGAQGGRRAVQQRRERLVASCSQADELRPLSSPVGVVHSQGNPSLLALSALTEVLHRYEAVRDAG